MKILDSFPQSAYDLVDKEKKEKFNIYYQFLVEYNNKCNLTSIIDEKEAYIKHFYDSVSAYSMFDSNSSVIEIGSGAGFPSLPLKIVREDLKMTLVEATGKKCTFLKEIVDKLGLKNVNIINSRAEELSKEVIHRENYDYCIARAVARLNSLNEYCLPFVKVGGKFIAYKGEAQEEIVEAKNSISILGGKLLDTYSYSLPENMGERTLVVIEKIKNTPDKYPRGQGKERSKPL